MMHTHDFTSSTNVKFFITLNSNHPLAVFTVHGILAAIAVLVHLADFTVHGHLAALAVLGHLAYFTVHGRYIFGMLLVLLY